MSLKYIELDNSSDLESLELSSLKKLDQDFFPQPWNNESWDHLFSGPSKRFLLIAKDDEAILGFILFDYVDADSFAHLLKILVSPNQRGQKIGKGLLDKAVGILKGRQIKSFFLEVEEKNIVAIQLYEGLGFKIIHRKKQFYSNGTDAIIMTLSI